MVGVRGGGETKEDIGITPTLRVSPEPLPSEAIL